MKGIRTGVCLFAVAGGLVACGGDGSEDGGDAFASEANAICREAAQKSVDVGVELGQAAVTSEQAVGETRQKLLAINSERNDQLAELEPPEDIRADWESYIESLDDYEALQRKLIAAEKAANTALIERLDRQQRARSEEAQLAVGDLELTGCDSELPKSDQEEVQNAIEATWTTKDADLICHGVLSPELVNEFFGSAEECEQFQKDQPEADLAESIDVSDLSGTEGIDAQITYTVVGGTEDGKEFSDALVYRDGEWVMFRSQALG